ncbi:DNA mismatch repair protein-like protein pms1 [Karstenula rhodostoma CBS 690.94]|uniref:DNA mismatch repair protein PMS1 n=1 Tax=Karstenula rhodostoma CBS 690.94 TaxID=1392251 RepID=A0A9P4PWT0_9PLEO|nr:DNA mismatch repair protein-like protein pms1 [Karstenula rhodostoma CBS 690.94]
MATIKPIEDRSVHQIQSGQVIVDLISVCKELVENSIDAGATSIEVRFKNSGIDAIEVQDNGSGIAPDDYDTVALKHYTSKLSTYDDLSSLQTFGFRGEALSSLCALSKFHIITARASDGPKGTKLEFEQSGKLKGTSVVAAKQGTTVVVETLFHNLPVRQKELEKNVKREYSKVLDLLQAYACISTGVKFNISNQVAKGKKTVAFSTNANPNTKENLANVFGAKALLALIPLSLQFEMDPSSRPGATQSVRNWSTQEDGSHVVKIVGHISRPVVGEGRGLPDRQMFFVNSRPCHLPQVKRAFNEVYKSYNTSQSPFVFADIQLDTNAYDVNVSPDKRTIMLHDQAALLESLRDALAELFEGHDQSVPQAQLLGKRTPSNPTFKPPALQQRPTTTSVPDGPFDLNPVPEPRKLFSTYGERSGSSIPAEEPPRSGFIKASLIERFAERDSEARIVRPPSTRKEGLPQAQDKVTEVRIDHHSSHQRSVSPSLEKTPIQDVQRAESPLFESEGASPPLAPENDLRPKVLEDFYARMTVQHAHPTLEPSPKPADSGEPPDVGEMEGSIPAIVQTPQRLTQSTIQNAFDRMRPMRTPVQQAIITIGDVTTVSTVGSESRASKRARVHTPKFSLNGTPLTQTPKRPNFLKGLRGFAAPGTQLEESDEEDEEDQGSSLPNAPGRSPSPQKKGPHREFEPPRTDEIDASSSAPPYAVPVEEDGEDNEDEVAGPQAEANDSDDEYVDESEKKAREESKIAQMITEAEETTARPTEENLKRATKLFKISQKKYSTTNLERVIKINIPTLATHTHNLDAVLRESEKLHFKGNLPTSTPLNNEDPEERLSLTVTKSDFNNMIIIGQFNLGFILAVRPPTPTSPTPDLFIIDQHASDEKYNFERFAATTVLVSQRLVHPHPLELTAVEQELILANAPSLTANGFVVEQDSSDDPDSRTRFKLTSLPMSKEVTFTPHDLSELLALIMDNPPSSSLSTSPHIPRPSKIRKLLASRACRGSVMIGKTLRKSKMEDIVQHMGSMDKPWSCPHGRPTMRHLYGLEKWEGWEEGDGIEPRTSYAARHYYWFSNLRLMDNRRTHLFNPRLDSAEPSKHRPVKRVAIRYPISRFNNHQALPDHF